MDENFKWFDLSVISSLLDLKRRAYWSSYTSGFISRGTDVSLFYSSSRLWIYSTGFWTITGSSKGRTISSFVFSGSSPEILSFFGLSLF
jgi:hypothetical protein